MKRIALINDQTRPETTGSYCRPALESLGDVEVEFFRPADLKSIPRHGFDLYLNIDDGMRYWLADDLRPSAWWAIDTHMDFDWCLEKARHYDFVFAAQQDGAAKLRAAGIETACWLALACDPDVHAKQDFPKQYDVCFVGNLFPGPRTDLVRLIQQYFQKTYVGLAYFANMARIYSVSRIVFNRSVKNDVNMRVFEALSCGSMLMTNDLADNGQAGMFKDGVQLATYRDAEELLDKLHYYLRNDQLRERIAAAGREEVLAKHTYSHRMRSILEGTELTAIKGPAAARCFSFDEKPNEKIPQR